MDAIWVLARLSCGSQRDEVGIESPSCRASNGLGGNVSLHERCWRARCTRSHRAHCRNERPVNCGTHPQTHCQFPQSGNAPGYLLHVHSTSKRVYLLTVPLDGRPCGILAWPFTHSARTTPCDKKATRQCALYKSQHRSPGPIRACRRAKHCRLIQLTMSRC